MPPVSVPNETLDPQFSIDKELYDSASSIRDEMNLLAERINKMDEHKAEVSEAVYLKVKSDYRAKLDEVKKAFEEKKEAIQKVLQTFYQGQEDQEQKLQKHREVLEEAKFRNFLGEYSDKKFKEISNRENAEVGKHEKILNTIQTNIKQYEDLIGGPAPELKIEPPLKVETEKTPRLEETVPPIKETHRPSEKRVTPALKEEEIETRAKAFAKQEKTTEEATSYFEGEEGDYFESIESVPPVPPTSMEAAEPRKTTAKTKAIETSSPAEKLKTEKVRPLKPSPVLEEGPTSKATLKTKEEAPAVKKTEKAQPGLGFDDSISSILRSIPLEEPEEEAPSEQTPEPSSEPTAETFEEEPPSITRVEEKSLNAKLICIEGDLQPAEIELGENTSIGRSPSNDVVLKEAKVSRQHAAIHLVRGQHVIVDLKSSNGVLVNSEKVEEHTLEDGDEIVIGSFRLLYRLG
jgi:hypothetical protein